LQIGIGVDSALLEVVFQLKNTQWTRGEETVYRIKKRKGRRVGLKVRERGSVDDQRKGVRGPEVLSPERGLGKGV